MSKRAMIPWMIALATTMGFFVGCTGRPGPEENSRQDASRSGAIVIPMDTVITDAVNYEGGDATDWKKFELSAASTVTVDMYWDTVGVSGELSIHDQYGANISSVTHDTRGQHDQISSSLPSAGLYYLRVHSNTGRSTYSIRLYLGPPRSAGTQQTQEDPRPEFDQPL